jgi:predicted secreted hydrolase
MFANRRPIIVRTRKCAWVALLSLAAAVLSRAAIAMPPPLPGDDSPGAIPQVAGAPIAPAHAGPPIGLPGDAGPHDATSAIEWWYFNSLLTTEKGHHFAIIGAFFRTGISPKVKGHYLIYALADLDNHTREPFAAIDPLEVDLLKAYLTLDSVQHPDDPKPLQLMAQLDRHQFAPPLHVAAQNATVIGKPLFSATMDSTTLEQASADGRSWRVTVSNDEWTLDLALEQPADRPPMLVGGTGHTGLKRADDMAYLSLTRMKASGTLTDGGVVDKVTGTGWLDRQWGTSWVVQNNGWDWFGLQLSDGSDLIVYQVRDNVTGRILRSDATLLNKEGIQTVDVTPTLTPIVSPTGTGPTALYTDLDSHIEFPQAWTLTMPKLGLTLTTQSVFPEQSVPVIGIGDAIWEGVVNVTGTHGGVPVTGQGYMELVGYKAKPAPAKPATDPPTAP